MSDDNSSRLLASFIQTTSDFRVLVNDGFKQLDRTLNRLEEDVATRLSKIEGDIQSLNDKLSTVDKQFQERLTTGNYDSTPLPEFPRMVLKDNPFADENIPRNVMPPPLPKGQSLQFRWEHFDYLCKEVLEALKKPYQDRYFATFKRNGIMYAQGCVLNMKAHHHLDPAVTWDNLTKALKHEAKDLCEKVVGQEFPLVACVEGWGARLLMRKAFLNCKEDESAGTAQPENSDQEIPDNIG
ncbi:hypothetical protein BJV82DRAFT_268872 [Fennellomyces sp. T-0311]|nr:hypothetical protein BJV82DRAFT_393967 [Fennellomyces sp. T-0311]KAI8148553.1 hypothetical protein BJV82DRAFT_268872 [Fennellomyces sp. T-0311]